MGALNIILKKLIKTGAGRMRFLMAFIGLSVALLLILAAVQLQVNYHTLLNSKVNKDSIANFLVVNKILTDQNLGETGLTDAEIADLRQQPFTEALGALESGRFKASIQSISDRFPFYTDIAFESVPDAFLDVTGTDWKWEEGQQTIPIIVPTMFLDFYNFQFAFSQGLPQLTQQVVKMILFKVNLYRPDGSVQSYTGRVVGFSDRISSMMVPQPFMQWANRTFGTVDHEKPSRVIIQTHDPGDPQLVTYLKEKGLRTDADKTRFSRYRQVVDIVVRISWVTGIILLLFALLVFTLFIQLTISSCREEIRLLITLGAAPKQLQQFLMKQFFPPNLLIMTLVIIVVGLLQYFVAGYLMRQNAFIYPWMAPETWITALFVLLLIYAINYITIRKNIIK